MKGSQGQAYLLHVFRAGNSKPHCNRLGGGLHRRGQQEGGDLGT